MLWVLKVTATKDYSRLLQISCVKRKGMCNPLLVVPRGKSVPRPILDTKDGSNVSMNSSFSKKQHKNALSKVLFSKT